MSERMCSVESCERPHRARGLCAMHYLRLQQAGTLDLTGTCCICGCSIQYPGTGPRRKLCEADTCRRAYDVRKSTEWRQRNPDKARAAKRRWNQANPGRQAAQMRRAHLRREYGLTVEEYDAMLERQAGGCAICGGQQTRRKWLVVDHDHVTGAVRGLLCEKHNLAIGLFNDDPSLLAAAIKYLST